MAVVAWMNKELEQPPAYEKGKDFTPSTPPISLQSTTTTSCLLHCQRKSPRVLFSFATSPALLCCRGRCCQHRRFPTSETHKTTTSYRKTGGRVRDRPYFTMVFSDADPTVRPDSPSFGRATQTNFRGRSSPDA